MNEKETEQLDTCPESKYRPVPIEMIRMLENETRVDFQSALRELKGDWRLHKCCNGIVASNARPKINEVSESEIRRTTQEAINIAERMNMSQMSKASEMSGTTSASHPPEGMICGF